jgi:hypothetical protein
MSMTWHQLLRKTWRDVTRQIDITLRHHERQDYDALYKEVSYLVNELKVHSADVSIHDCQPINPSNTKVLFIQLTINEGILCDQPHRVILTQF